ncbi:mechanosensitive ion channel [Cryobacterium adonitolivorans]|uniref:Mechanosensitive ion channel n=1 Tax=Cryobacterium adonitolivorans TaxID=1259189 RepID=A0A4R8W662_9MICO|nr:mechanosensitive ion channel domain-containing protein [Cryobacterium adonitolivorans]TFC01393.1 mechanosensitive ion channel [Cryobacterium adonitolivorans]
MNWDTFWAAADSIYNLTIVQVAVIIIFSLVARWLLLFVIHRVVAQIVSGVKKTQNVDDTQALNVSPVAAVRTVQRTRTLGSVLTNIVNVVVVVIAILLIVTELNPEILTSFALLTAALGAGLGFGAQNIVKDVLNGLFMVMEDQLGVGDVVDLGPATGVVEAVGIRITQVRDVNGTLWFVRNGEILRVGNMSQGWARVIIDLAVPYKTDVEAVQTEMLRVAVEMATNSKWRSRVLEKPEIWGIESIAEDAVVIRIVIKTRTTAKDDVARELRLRLKRALDAMGVELPSLTSIVLTGFEGAASVQGARPPRTTPLPVIAPPKKAPRKSRAARAAEAAAAAASASPHAAAPQSAAPQSAAPHPDARHPATPQPAALRSAKTPASPLVPATPQTIDAAAQPTTRIPSIARNQAPRAPRTVRLPVQDASPEFSDSPDGPATASNDTTAVATPPVATPAQQAATPPQHPAATDSTAKPTAKPATKQPAKPKTRPIDKQAEPQPEVSSGTATTRDGDTHD